MATPTPWQHRHFWHRLWNPDDPDSYAAIVTMPAPGEGLISWATTAEDGTRIGEGTAETLDAARDAADRALDV